LGPEFGGDRAQGHSKRAKKSSWHVTVLFNAPYPLMSAVLAAKHQGDRIVKIDVKNAFGAVVSVFGASIFVDSLRYKFTDHPKTQVIFGALNDWAGGLGLPGLFAHTGLFSQYTIGSAELVASGLLIAGLHPRLRRLQGLGALVGFAVMSGAVNFHLFTPLGTDPNHDGGGLFVAAVTLWLLSAGLILVRLGELKGLFGDIGRALIGTPSAQPKMRGMPVHRPMNPSVLPAA
jgi:hypothetical protein